MGLEFSSVYAKGWDQLFVVLFPTPLHFFDLECTTGKKTMYNG